MTDRSLANSVVRVDGGRGFVVRSPYRGRLVITAAHCLPNIMPAFADNHERHYRNLLAPLGAEPAITAACAFVDPIADIAVLEAADGQEWPEQHEAFCKLTDAASPLKIGTLSFTDRDAKTGAWVLSLKGDWIECTVSQVRPLAALIVHENAGSIKSGMSGSPIIRDDGAIGVVCVSTGGGDHHGPHPYLRGHLPAWMLQGR